MKVTIAPGSVAIGIVVVDICFKFVASSHKTTWFYDYVTSWLEST